MVRELIAAGERKSGKNRRREDAACQSGDASCALSGAERLL